MVSMINDEDRIKLSSLDTRVLVALLGGEMGKYDIGRQIEADTGSGYHVSNGALARCITGLVAFTLIQEVPTKRGRALIAYDITDFGRQMLSSNLDSLRKLVKVADERLAR
jgi:DNA-binding PadR family transcriptional regulator